MNIRRTATSSTSRRKSSGSAKPMATIVEKPPDSEALSTVVAPKEAAATGIVVRVRGSVVDVEFADGALPALSEALVIEWDGTYRLLIEVEEHLDPHTVRTVAMQNTAVL